MKARALTVISLLLAAAAASTAIACATDETGGEAPPGSPPPSTDGGVDAASADGDADAAPPPIPCTPDVVCPFGPFDPTMVGGPLDPRTRINTIRARSERDVWIAGVNGTVLHWDGTAFKRSDTGSVETMNDLWLREGEEISIAKLTSLYRRGEAVRDAGAPSADGWTAAGAPAGPSQVKWSSGQLVSAWTAPGAEWLFATTIEPPPPPFAGPQTEVNGLWRIRVNSATGQLEIGNAVPVNTCAAIGCRQMTSVHGISGDDLWAVGYTGATFHITEAQSASPKLKPFDSQTLAELDGVFAVSATEAWSVGGLGVIRHYTGHPFAWDIVTDVPTNVALHAVSGSSASDVWAVGDDAVVLHYDGKAWSRVPVAGLGSRRPDLYSVYSPAPGRIWIGGDGVFLSLGGKP